MHAISSSRRGSAMYVVLWLVVLLLLTAGRAYPQSSSTILGVVKDTSGAIVPGASVTIQNEDTAQIRSTSTDNDGAYRVPALQAGHYSVRVEKDGFNAHLDRGLILDVAQELAVNPVLQVGTSQQEVTVTGETSQVETVTSSLGSLVNDQKVAELPLNGRNYLDLTLMLPGVAKNQNLGTVAGSSGTSYSSNGAPIIANNFLLDGTSIVNPVGWNPTSIAGTTLGLDGIQEFKIITNGFSAEYGMTMGSQMVMVSKGGTNQFHGDAFEYLRNDWMRATISITSR